VNRDDIRFQLYGSYWGDGVDELVVTEVETAMVAAAVAKGKSVVIDATHLRSAWITRWRRLYPNLEIRNFEVPLDTVIERDTLRGMAGERQVGYEAIRDMAKRYHIKADGVLPPLPDPVEAQAQWIPATRNASLLEAIIVDIDGTLANHEGIRSPYDTSRYHLDSVHDDVASVVSQLQSDGDDGRYVKLILVSGRDEQYRDVTLTWVKKHAGIYPDEFYMRPEGDKRNDAVVKHELYHKYIDGKYDVIGVFDDRGRVLRMWRAIGLTTFAVGDTDNYNF
jgi:hypothetical protein